jgi:uncharacterized protein YbcI
MKHGRKGVTVFMKEDTTVIALQGSLTAAERVLEPSQAGASQQGGDGRGELQTELFPEFNG